MKLKFYPLILHFLLFSFLRISVEFQLSTCKFNFVDLRKFSINDNNRFCLPIFHDDVDNFELYHNVIALFNRSESLMKVNLPIDLSNKIGSLNGKAIEIISEAYEGRHIRWLRIVSFRGAGYSVFNFVALPRLEYNLPIFSADIVSLPGGLLAAIDFQPLSNNPAYFSSEIYSPYQDTFNKWKDVFPSGGPLPAAATPFFSPFVIWTRLAKNELHLQNNIRKSFLEYSTCYSDLLSRCNTTSTSTSSSKESYQEMMTKYLTYRIENDPASKLLEKTFGCEWKQQILEEVMFPNTNIYSAL